MRIESVRDLHSQFPDVDGYWASHDLIKTEAAIRQALPSDLNGPWNSVALSAITQLVRVLNLQGKSSEAKEMLDLARKQVQYAEPQTRMRTEIRLLLEEGRHFCMAMMPAKAQGPFSRAWKMASDSGEVFLTIESAVMLSVSQPPKYQNEWLQRALDLAAKTDDEQAKLWLAQLHLMDGWHAFDFRRFEDALRAFQLALARPRGHGEMTDVILIKWCIARCLRALGRVAEALEMQRELYAKLNSVPEVNGYVFLEIAECLQLLQNTEEAKTFFELAYKELSLNGWYSDNKSMELGRMQELYKKRY
jgi:tetratricopeptide (TPR) repeat protein